MKMSKFTGLLLCLVFTFVCFFDCTTSLGQTTTATEWAEYKALYGKDYTNSATTDAFALYYYSYNKMLIANHNAYYRRGLRTFGLRINQFTDMRLISFNALFPVTTKPSESFNTALPQVDTSVPVPDSFDPETDLGLNSTIEDQGTVCNSGWAYATAKSIEILKAYQSGVMQPNSLSAQNLIDCAGRSRGCTNQVPQIGFDFLTQYQQELHLTSQYPNNNNEAQQGMCILPQTSPQTVSLQQYGFINDGIDATMKRYIAAQYPVVIEFNPTSFEFMHYSEGVFQQPLLTSRGSHFMTVIGYGVNSTLNLNYFIVQNSFGNTWGENGKIRIAYTAAKPLAKSAILPIT